MSNCCGDIVYEGLCVRGRPVKVIDCVACGFKHLYPKPGHQELADYYMKDYFSTEKPDYAATSGTESEYQYVVDLQKMQAAGLRAYPAKAHRVLDYGCGPSAPFLKHLAQHIGSQSFVGFGYEPHQEKDVRGVEIYGGAALVTKSLASFDRPGDRFDVVHMGFVLEHASNPFEEIVAAGKLLAPGGRLVVEVPNDFSRLQMAIWKKSGGTPWWVSSPDHQNYFSAQSLTTVLERCGFNRFPAYQQTTYPVELFIAQGDDYRTSPEAREKLLANRARLQSIWAETDATSIGRTVWMVALANPEA